MNVFVALRENFSFPPYISLFLRGTRFGNIVEKGENSGNQQLPTSTIGVPGQGKLYHAFHSKVYWFCLLVKCFKELVKERSYTKSLLM